MKSEEGMDKRKNKIKYKLHTEDSLILRERYQTVIEQINLVIYDINLVNGNIYISSQCQYVMDTSKSNKNRLRQRLNLSSIHPEDKGKFRTFVRQDKEKAVEGTLIYRRKNDLGSYSWIKSSRKNSYDEDGNLIRVIGTEQDISSEMNAYQEVNKSIDIDPLTGIYNQPKFTTSVVDIISTYKDKKFAIMVFDIDNFRIINDLHGSIEGDKILQHIGQVLSRRNLGPSYLYCRMYSDNFAILLEYENDDDIIQLANQLAEEICNYPIKLGGMLSFGVCKIEDFSTSISTLCDFACLAKKKVKGNVVHLLSFYDEALRNKALEEKDIEHRMETALDEHQFEMYLQPKVSIINTDVVGAEALVRWNHPRRGILTPDKFIPLFEKNGFIVKMDYYIWERAFATIRNWIDEGYNPVPISVNVSRVHIYDSNIVEIFKNLAIKYRVPTYMIELELTETTYFDNFEKLSMIILDLKKEGFILSIDDFGSGYTSLNMLKDIPIDVIKFDKEFTKEILTTERGKTVIQYTIAMAKQLNIEVIAEGVEDFYQAQFLLEAGCEVAQGYFYSKPLPIHKFELYTFGYCYKIKVL